MTPSAIGRWGSNFPKIDPVTPVADGQLLWRLSKPQTRVGDRER